jgi:hypothetical protein
MRGTVKPHRQPAVSSGVNSLDFSFPLSVPPIPLGLSSRPTRVAKDYRRLSRLPRRRQVAFGQQQGVQAGGKGATGGDAFQRPTPFAIGRLPMSKPLRLVANGLEKQATAGVVVIINGNDALGSLSAAIVFTQKQVGDADSQRGANGVNWAAREAVQENASIVFGY